MHTQILFGKSIRMVLKINGYNDKVYDEFYFSCDSLHEIKRITIHGVILIDFDKAL